MERYTLAGSEPKLVLWYDTGHELNSPRTLTDRAVWLAQQIGLGAIRGAPQRAVDADR